MGIKFLVKLGKGLLSTFLLSTFLLNTQVVLAQTVDDFKLEILNYSDQPDINAEHVHLLSVTNNTSSKVNYSLSSLGVKPKLEYEDVINNKEGKSYQEDNSEIQESESLTISFLNESKNAVINFITVDSFSEVKFYVKVLRTNNTEQGSSLYHKIIVGPDDSSIREHVIIRTVIPNPNLLGH
ncbi:hypothetical protein [Seonamhaeicola sp. ML3]|uniref:hypothetical protein n=1 Tax=Seonamhaeicola sp. ML3 TaxID=2937786 RepID=UPI00200C285D|nr:hypothetical protein [Seonamhaeicola sp. ML3]